MMPFLIDGHNLRWTINKNDELFEPVEDVGMCGMLDDFLRHTRDSAEIVFDGVGPPNRAPFKRFAALRVLFAGAGVEADAIIEEKLRLCQSPKRLRVVSNDRRIVHASKRSKSLPWGCEAFWRRVLSTLDRKRPAPEPSSKRAGIDEEETKAWLRFFDLEN